MTVCLQCTHTCIIQHVGWWDTEIHDSPHTYTAVHDASVIWTCTRTWVYFHTQAGSGVKVFFLKTGDFHKEHLVTDSTDMYMYMYMS